MAAPKRKKGLGRGLDALINETPKDNDVQATLASATQPDAAPSGTPAPSPVSGGPLEVSIERIKRNPWQPRQEFEQSALDDLTRSIGEMGLLQPLLVRKAPDGDGYELIAGERRLTAARAAGLPRVPVILKDYTDCEALEVALVENLQREDLNVIEEAEGYQALAEKFGLTQDQIAKRVGKGRASITNALRTLKLPEEVREMLYRNLISTGHAKVLLGVEIEDEQVLLAHRVIKEGLSVRALEKMVARLHRPAKKARVKKPDMPESHLRYLTDKLYQTLGTAVHLTPCATLANGKKVKGRIEIEYYSNDDLDRILSVMGIADEL
jgi:ParB family chromosome partitioning protein